MKKTADVKILSSIITLQHENQYFKSSKKKKEKL